MLSNCGTGEDSWEALGRRSTQLILKEINPDYSLEGLMLKLKLQFFGHLMWTADSLEKTLMLSKTEDKRRRGWLRMRWLDSITDSTDMNLSKYETNGHHPRWHKTSRLHFPKIDATVFPIPHAHVKYDLNISSQKVESVSPTPWIWLGLVTDLTNRIWQK